MLRFADEPAAAGSKHVSQKKSSTDAPAATRRDVIAGVSMSIGSLALRPGSAVAAAEEISHSRESIHQEVTVKAERARVYAALTDAAQFQKVVLLSAAVRSGMVQATKPAEIAREPGGAFSLFGGHISGRTIELVPNERVVQAWRAGDWPTGVYSIARFELLEEGQGTRLVFDHTGFPVGQAEHLAAGWKGNYWEPLEKVLAWLHESCGRTETLFHGRGRDLCA
jgi:activator of HSP90 ATPase